MGTKVERSPSALAILFRPFMPGVEFADPGDETGGVDREAVGRLKERGVKRLVFSFDVLESGLNCTELLRADPKLSEEEEEALREPLRAFADEVDRFMVSLHPPGPDTTYVGAVAFDLRRERVLLAYKTYVWKADENRWAPVRDSAVRVEVSLRKLLKLKALRVLEKA